MFRCFAIVSHDFVQSCKSAVLCYVLYNFHTFFLAQKSYKRALFLRFAYFSLFSAKKYNSCAIRAQFVRKKYDCK